MNDATYTAMGPALPSPRASRRRFLIGAGATVGGLAMGSCGGSSPVIPSATTSSPAPNGVPIGDLHQAALAASLENLFVYAYTVSAEKAADRALGVPAAVAALGQTAKSHHQQHASAWNSLLNGADVPVVSGVDAVLGPTVNAMLAQVNDAASLARLELQLENIAAQTYQAIGSQLKNASALHLATTIQPVEMQHAAVLSLLLGRYPGYEGPSGVAEAFTPTSLARTQSDYPGT